MRLLYAIDSLAPAGAETSLVAMTPSLVRAGIEMHVLPLRSALDLAPALMDAGATVHRRDGQSGGRIGNVRAVMDCARQVHPDLIHTTLFEADIAGRTAAKLSGIVCSTSLVNEYYGASHATEVSPLKLRAARALDRFTCRFAGRFHAVSQSVVDSCRVELRLDPARIDVIPRGRDARKFPFRDMQARAALRGSLGLDDHSRVVLGVGRMEPQKGFLHLLDAIPAVAEAVPDAVVLIAGRDGRDSDQIRARARDLPLKVRFLGQRSDMPQVLAAADVLAFPSEREGSPGTLIEAMAAGTPIVSSDIGPCLEVLGGRGANTALVTGAGNAGQLAAAIVATFSDHAAASERARVARVRFEESYTIEAVGGRMAGFFLAASEAKGAA